MPLSSAHLRSSSNIASSRTRNAPLSRRSLPPSHPVSCPVCSDETSNPTHANTVHAAVMTAAHRTGSSRPGCALRGCRRGVPAAIAITASQPTPSIDRLKLRPSGIAVIHSPAATTAAMYARGTSRTPSSARPAAQSAMAQAPIAPAKAHSV